MNTRDRKIKNSGKIMLASTYDFHDRSRTWMYCRQMYFVRTIDNILYLILIHEKDSVLILYQEECFLFAKEKEKF